MSGDRRSAVCCLTLTLMLSVCLIGEVPADCALQPFTDYYSQAEHSVHALIQIRSVHTTS